MTNHNNTIWYVEYDHEVNCYVVHDNETDIAIINDTGDEVENAELIAAAPELYRSLQILVDYAINRDLMQGKDLIAAIEALRKARGEHDAN